MMRVSVVVPAFNAERTIEAAVESVLAQTHSDFELIVCDDASADKTPDIVLSYADERVRLVKNTRNLGEGSSRDKAIAAAHGEWIAVLDADDAWSPDRLEKLTQVAASHPGCMVLMKSWNATIRRAV